MDDRPLISLVVAKSKNGVIGCDNRLPWHVPSDLRRFKEVTLGHPIVMGRNTFQSIGRSLPGRTNIVVSRDPLQFQSSIPKGIEVFASLEAALARASEVCLETGVDEIMVVGGGEVFAALFPQADKVYLTEIDVVVNDVDAVYFDPDLLGWKEQVVFSGKEPQDDYSYRFAIYERPEELAANKLGCFDAIAAE